MFLPHARRVQNSLTPKKLNDDLKVLWNNSNCLRREAKKSY